MLPRPRATGIVQLPSRQILQWTPKEVFAALQSADTGTLERAADLCGAIMRDPVVRGVFSTRTLGMLGLPLTWDGPEPPDWYSRAPEAELDRVLTWGLMLGVGLAHIRLDGSLEAWHPRWLRQDVTTKRWYVLTTDGEREVTPGNGRWILYTPYGHIEPWDYGLWTALALPWLIKQFALHDRARASEVFGSAMVLGKAAEGSTEGQRRKWLTELEGLSRSTRMVLPDGYDLTLLEAQGQTWGIYDSSVLWADNAIIIAIAGQIVTTLGQSGFSRGDIHESIAHSLIKFGAETFSSALACQYVEPVWRIYSYPRWSIEATKVAQERAAAIQAFGGAVDSANTALASYNLRVDATQLAANAGIPTLAIAPPPGAVAPAPVAPIAAESNRPDVLAERMTADGVTRCEHGCLNRCRLCGIERVREYAMNDFGEPEWAVRWQAIGAAAPEPLRVAADGRRHALRRILASELPADGITREFRIFAYGANVTDHGVFTLDRATAEQIASEYRSRDMTIDLEHLSLDPESKSFDPDARGYSKVEARDDGLYAVNVRWTPDGARRLKSRSQRYISPAFNTDEKGRIVGLINCALTALPAMHVPPLVAASKRGNMTYAQFLKALAAAIKASKLDAAKTALETVKCGGAITPDMVKGALDAIASGDTNAAMQALTDMLAALVAGEPPAKEPAPPAGGPPPAEGEPPADAEMQRSIAASVAAAVASAVKPLADEVNRMRAAGEDSERKVLLGKLNPGAQKALAGMPIEHLRSVVSCGVLSEPTQPAKKTGEAADPLDGTDESFKKALRSMGQDPDDLRAYSKDPKGYLAARKTAAQKGA